MDHLLGVFSVALASTAQGFYPDGDAQLKESTRNRLLELLRAINSTSPDKIAAAGAWAICLGIGLLEFHCLLFRFHVAGLSPYLA